ncbi:hypothetical protein TCAL_02255 [Tigriopus californicus]|uniref:Uncharacterized protein n=1 Tax=Tigriopus californicus TaxID=6832 RepID=A0A553PNG0_TIGCA|nr:hypothetical protein TCAL_02255 [Tigriopus californicus]
MGTLLGDLLRSLVIEKRGGRFMGGDKPTWLTWACMVSEVPLKGCDALHGPDKYSDIDLGLRPPRSIQSHEGQYFCKADK